jgi:predicted nucleic acid-binding protein
LIVVDASAVLELLLRTDKGIKVQERVLDSGESFHAPHLIDIEVTQTLRRLVSLKEITATRGRQALEDHAALNIKRAEHKDLLERIWTLRDSVTAHDAAYVVLAEILDAPLVTCDATLARSHGHRARIELTE